MCKMSVDEAKELIRMALRETESHYYSVEEPIGNPIDQARIRVANERRFVFGFAYQIKKQVDEQYANNLVVDVEPIKWYRVNCDADVPFMLEEYDQQLDVRRSPDVVVHRSQGNIDAQCLVIEVKCHNSLRGIGHDLEKLRCYSKRLNFSHVAFVAYGDDHNFLFNHVVGLLQAMFRNNGALAETLAGLIVGCGSQNGSIVEQPFIA